MSVLQVRDDAGVRWLRLARPEARNGIDPVLRDALEHQLRAADADPCVRCVVLAGEGPDFCTGADLAANAVETETPPEYRQRMRPYQELFRVLWELETPVVSAVRGRVAGIGWLLALLADLVVASETARWTHVFSRRGMVPHAGDPYFLPRILPFHVLNEIALLGDTVGSADLHRWGAINRLVPEDDVEPTAAALAGRVATGPTLSLGQAKRLYRRSLSSDLSSAFADELATISTLSLTHDRAEGISALFEGRRPRFEGR